MRKAKDWKPEIERRIVNTERLQMLQYGAKIPQTAGGAQWARNDNGS